MQLFYFTELSENLKVGDSFTLNEEQSHHIIVVLRHAAGDSIMVCNGKGWLYGARITDAHKKKTVAVIDTVDGNFGSEGRREITIGLAPTKNIERTEWAVEKMVEIGATRIVPIISSHSERKVVKTDRLKRIALSAAQQSLKGFLPIIDEPTPFKEFVEKFDGGYIAHCNEGQKVTIAAGDENYCVLIGPEGDFSPEEVAFALKHNYKEITLGTARLRTETAAVCAAYLCTL